MLEYQSDTLASLTETRRASVHLLNETSPQSHSSLPTSNLYPTGWSVAEQLPPLTIPVKHRTSSSYLLTLPAIRSLIGENPPGLFFQLESKHPVPKGLSLDGLSMVTQSRATLDLTQQHTDELVSSFFATAHTNHPLLDREEFEAIYFSFLHSEPDTSIECALCMIVFSLGAVASSSQSPDFDESPPGIQYMQRALPTLISLSSWSFTSSLLLPQALVLASLYFAYIVRPLQSWKLIQAASSNLQLRLSGMNTHTESSSSKEAIIRLFWSCFLIECDRLAELELPRSGLQQLTDSISLPDCTNLDMRQSTCYLAEITVRRLLNRIHNSLYPSKRNSLDTSPIALRAPEDLTTDEVLPIMAVCDELYSQLETWHSSIPEVCRPALATTSLEGYSHREAILRIRYYAARHIIWRPFVIHIATHGMDAASSAVYERAVLCLDSCRNYILNTTAILQRPSLYTWTFSLS